MTDAWDPNQYHRFQTERSQPFHDLLGLVQSGLVRSDTVQSGPAGAEPVGRFVDLGCGSGELTEVAATRLGAAEALGIDSSPAMLKEAEAHARPGLRFEAGDIAG